MWEMSYKYTPGFFITEINFIKKTHFLLTVKVLETLREFLESFDVHLSQIN